MCVRFIKSLTWKRFDFFRQSSITYKPHQPIRYNFFPWGNALGQRDREGYAGLAQYTHQNPMADHLSPSWGDLAITASPRRSAQPDIKPGHHVYLWSLVNKITFLLMRNRGRSLVHQFDIPEVREAGLVLLDRAARWNSAYILGVFPLHSSRAIRPT